MIAEADRHIITAEVSELTSGEEGNGHITILQQLMDT